MAYSMTTLNGYNFYDMSSMLQKAIRRGDLYHAGFALKELIPKYSTYVWKRLLTISAEDCYGIMTKEIIGLEQADEFFKKNNKGKPEGILFAKAVVLLCLARKNRDACYVACNFMQPDTKLDPDDIPDLIDMDEQNKLGEKVPSWVYDCHTYKGKASGKNILNMIEDEQSSLSPKQISLFDNGDWSMFIEGEQKNGHMTSARERAQFDKFKEGKELDPTHGGADWPGEEER